MAKGFIPRNNQPWKIGIDYPKLNSAKGNNYTTYLLSNMAIATSGNYRHFKIDQVTGKRFSHTIDPRTGHPVKHRLASVTVFDRLSCMKADALATALMVMGYKKGTE